MRYSAGPRAGSPEPLLYVVLERLGEDWEAVARLVAVVYDLTDAEARKRAARCAKWRPVRVYTAEEALRPGAAADALMWLRSLKR